MKINNKILSIPPFISTSWNEISSLYVRNDVLIVLLMEGNEIHIPNLDMDTLFLVFNTHANVLEEQQKTPAPTHAANLQALPFGSNVDIPFRLGIGLGTIQDIGSSIFQHDPSQANIAPIPIEILQKIISITQIVSPGGLQMLSKPETECNCVHCQVANILLQEFSDMDALAAIKQNSPEKVSEADLHFQNWEIQQIGDQLYSVSNRLDGNEKYRVHLGDPVGCTCGKSGCDHIVAVLKS